MRFTTSSDLKVISKFSLYFLVKSSIEYFTQATQRGKEVGASTPQIANIHPIIRMYATCTDFGATWAKGWSEGWNHHTFKNPASLKLEYIVQDCGGDEKGTAASLKVSWSE